MLGGVAPLSRRLTALAHCELSAAVRVRLSPCSAGLRSSLFSILFSSNLLSQLPSLASPSIIMLRILSALPRVAMRTAAPRSAAAMRALPACASRVQLMHTTAAVRAPKTTAPAPVEEQEVEEQEAERGTHNSATRTRTQERSGRVADADDEAHALSLRSPFSCCSLVAVLLFSSRSVP